MPGAVYCVPQTTVPTDISKMDGCPKLMAVRHTESILDQVELQPQPKQQKCWALSAAFFDESQPVLPPTPDRKKLRTGLPHPQR